jgi:HD-like signal output (HDOD) protein
MPLPDDLKLLDADLPACPRALLDMLVLLNDENAPVAAMATVIERDMALAAAVVRTVNSAMYGLLRRVETVNEAVRYLGTREVAAITFSTALRAAFPSTPQLEALWDFASRCGMLMGRSAGGLGLDAWRAHSAGLFARCGQAVLMAKYPAVYAALVAELALDDSTDPAALAQAEVARFGVHHAMYGSALCAAWGLGADVVKYVRERIEPPRTWPALGAPLCDLLTLGALTERLLEGGQVDACASALADEQPRRDVQALIGAVRGPWEQLSERGTTERPHGTAVH